MNDNQESRVHAVRMDSTRSANEIINGLDNLFRLKDLDLFLVDRFMCPRGLPLSQANPSWRERDHRQASMVYGGAMAALGILMHSAGALLYMPLVVFILILSRYLHLRNEINIFSRRKSTHSQMLDIVKYAVLREKVEKKPTIFSDMYIKYSTLRYIKSRRSINGKSFLTVFLSFDKTLQFSDMLSEVVDDVLNYVIEQEHSDISDLVQRIDSEDDDLEADYEDGRDWAHTSPENGFLQESPGTSQKDAADSERKKFSRILKKGASAGAGAAAMASLSASSAMTQASSSQETVESAPETIQSEELHPTVSGSDEQSSPLTPPRDDEPRSTHRHEDDETKASSSAVEEESATGSTSDTGSNDAPQDEPGEESSNESSDALEFEDDDEVTYQEFSEGAFDLEDIDKDEDPADSEVEGSSDDDFLKELGIE